MKRVAVIGAGASGLTAVKCCLDEGLEPVCFERTSEIGGLWNYKEETNEGQGCVMKSTVINTSKEMMCYSDFPIPKEFPVFMPNTYVQRYLQLYGESFGMKKYVQFQTEVLHVKRCDDFASSGQWDVKIRHKDTGTTEDLVFDAVLICTGHHAEVNRPTFPGLDRFRGKVLHSHDYRHAEGYEDKRVLIIGIGNSGGDMANELSRVANKVYLSTRRGTWIYHRLSEKGLPLDMHKIRRSFFFFKSLLPDKLLNKYAERFINKRIDHTLYCLKPNYPPLAQHAMVNDDLPNRIITGSVEIKPNVAEFFESGVRFEDGTYADDIDVVILATGFVFGFPFLDKSVTNVVNNEVNLYKYMFPPDLEKHTLAVIGCIQPLGAIMPISELQCRLATQVFKGDVVLPRMSEMKSNIQSKKDQMSQQYVKTQRHTIQVEFICFLDELATLTGCKPNFAKMFLTDSQLALTCVFGPCTPYQYRLVGPGKWSGARKAIMTQWDRTIAPLQTRPLGYKKQSSQMGFVIFLVLFVAFFTFCINLFM